MNLWYDFCVLSYYEPIQSVFSIQALAKAEPEIKINTHPILHEKLLQNK